MTDSFCERVITSFESRPNKIAMRIVGDDREVYTFAEMLHAVRAVTYRIKSESIQPGDRIALIGANHPNWAIAYLAILFSGAVCVPIDPEGEIETISNFLENSEAKFAFIDSGMVERFGRIRSRIGHELTAVCWTSGNDADSNGFEKFSDWLATDYPESFSKEMPIASGDDPALLIYTSGTTGTPKGVPLTHGNIVAELDGINEVLKLDDKERILSLLPLFHAYLQIVNLWVATTFGCEVGYLKELSPTELSAALEKFRPTILTTVPRLWYLFHKKIFDAVETKGAAARTLFRVMLGLNGLSRSVIGINLGTKLFGKVHRSFGDRLRIAISAGSRFDEKVALDFHKLGFTILQGYGLTETSGAATATYEKDNRIGTVGKPMITAEVRIDEPDPDGVGEILIKGDVVFKGYYKNPEATAEVFTEDGWFRSGDLGKIDRHGHLHIVGRAKDVIILPSGKNVHPEDIEAHYLKAPEVEELAVVGIMDSDDVRAGAEKLAAVVVPNFEYLKIAKLPNSREAVRYALDNLGRELPEYQRVRNYIVRTEPLPRTATRKIKRFVLKKEIESGKVGGFNGDGGQKEWKHSEADEKLLSSPVAKAVAASITPHLREQKQLHPEMNLEIDLGLDSLSRAEVFASLEHTFKTDFTAEQLAEALTLAHVIELVSDTPAAIESSNDGSELHVGLNWSGIIEERGDVPPEVTGALKSRPLFVPLAFAAYRCFNLFCRLFMRLEVKGKENLTKIDGPFIVCPNHQSFLDPFVVCSNYPYAIFNRTFHVGAKMFFEGGFMGKVAQMLRVIPIDQDTQLLKAMKAGATGLRRGFILHIYPEGERAFDGRIHDFKNGAAILSTELNIPIVPVAIDGLHKVWARRSMKIRPAKVRISIGSPMLPSEIKLDPDDASADGHYKALTAELRKRIEKMIAEHRAV